MASIGQSKCFLSSSEDATLVVVDFDCLCVDVFKISDSLIGVGSAILFLCSEILSGPSIKGRRSFPAFACPLSAGTRAAALDGGGASCMSV